MSVKSGELLLLSQVASQAASQVADTRDPVYEDVIALLKASGFDVVLAADEGTCLARLRVQRPEVMLVSLADAAIGADTLATLRKAAPRIPLLLLADAASVSKVVPCLEQGADDYLLLPLGDPGILNYVVRDNIKRKRELKRRKLNEKMLARTNKTLLDSLQVLEQDQQAGFRVQQGMMPETPLVFDDLTFAHLIVPSLILSGDAIDYFELPDQRLLFYIADVSGHGAAGAIVTVVLKGLFQQLLSEYENLGITAATEILEWLNHELLAVRLEQHVTLFLGLVSENRKTLEYSNAAHFPGTIIYSERGAQYLELGGLPLGIVPKPGYVGCQCALPKTFTLVMFSDGVFEIMLQDGLQAKEKHLISLVNCTKGEIDCLAENLGLNSVVDIPDDIAIFTVTKTG